MSPNPNPPAKRRRLNATTTRAYALRLAALTLLLFPRESAVQRVRLPDFQHCSTRVDILLIAAAMSLCA